MDYQAGERDVHRQQPKRDNPSEFKFYTTTRNARVAVLEALAREKVQVFREKVQVFAFSVFTGSQLIPHTPANYGVLLCELLRMCGAEQEHVANLAIDTPFNTPQQREQLSAAVHNALDLDVALDYVDSIKNPYVQLVDFVAGAVRANHIGRDKLLYQFIRPRMISDQLVKWKTLRREWMEKDWRG